MPLPIGFDDQTKPHSMASVKFTLDYVLIRAIWLFQLT